MRELQFDKVYLKMAHEWAQLSRAKRLKVGCLVVKDGQVISNGYNGTPSGFDNECEFDGFDNAVTFKLDKEHLVNSGSALITKPEVLHAETNAITKLARSTNSSEGATLYCTHSPCFDCAKLIIQSGIIRVVYTTHYRCDKGVDLLSRGNIMVEQIEELD